MSRLPAIFKIRRRFFSSSANSSSFFATTPIYYATNAPHIGHLHSSILTDAAVRCSHLRSKKTKKGDDNGDDVISSTFLSTGTDEHGQKVAAAAVSLFQKEALLPSTTPLNQESKNVLNPEIMRREALSFCDKVSDKYRDMNNSFSINAGQFVRTTSWRHACVVGWLWRRLERSGAIYVGEHEGWYCQSDEAFLTDSQVVTRKDYLEQQKTRLDGEKASGEGGGGGVENNLSPMFTSKTFASDKEREQWLAEKVSSESGHTVERLKETNFMFRLTSFKSFLQELHSTPVQSASTGSQATYSFVEPQVRAEEMLSFIKSSEAEGDSFRGTYQGLRDFSVSRRRDRVPWGLPVPPFSSLQSSSTTSTRGALEKEPHNVYVWLDALASYLTASAANAEWAKAVDAKESIASRKSASTLSLPIISVQEQEKLMESLPLDADWRTLFPAWPADLHVLGKDILKFHSLYWPAFLHGAGLPPPKRIVAHGHWTVSGSKMSKSIGNVVAPHSLLLENGGGYKSDAVRYFLLREGRLHLDGDFNPQLLQQRCSKECADTFGNLASRILNKLFMPFGVATLFPGIKLGLPQELLKSVMNDDTLKKVHGEFYSTNLPSFSQEISLSNQQIELLSQGVVLKDALEEGYLSAEPGPALEKLINFLQLANKTYSDSAPWKVKPEKEDIERWANEKDPTKVILSDRNLQLAGTLYTILEALRVSAILLQPTMPVCAPQLLNALGIESRNSITEKEDENKDLLDLTSWESAHPCLSRPHHFLPTSVLQSKNAATLVLFPKPPREEDVSLNKDSLVKGTETVPKSRKAKKAEAKLMRGTTSSVTTVT
jgi:methionyl-tRNA synthetase